MMRLQKIKDHNTLVRDSSTKAIINTDVEKLQAYRFTRDVQRKLSDLARDFTSLRNEVAALNDAIKELREKK